MRRKHAILVVSTVTFVVAVLIATACASKALAPTDIPSPGSSTQQPGSSTQPAVTTSSEPSDAFIVYRDDTGALAVRSYLTGKTYRQPVDGTIENITQIRCTNDGSRIAYLKQVFADATKRQVIIRGTNAPAAPLEVSSRIQWIAWSPDASKLGLVDWDGQAKHGKIEIEDIATGETTTILERDQYIGNISWSPTGDLLTFYLQSPDFSESEVYTLKPDGSDLKQLTPGDGELDWYDPAWSPDGKSLVAAGSSTDTVQLYRIDIESGEIAQLTTSEDITKRGPAFSPDGSIIAFTGQVILPAVSVNVFADHTTGIFTINPDGTGERAITSDPRGTTPGPNDLILNAYLLGWCAAGPWLDNLWTEAQ